MATCAWLVGLGLVAGVVVVAGAGPGPGLGPVVGLVARLVGRLGRLFLVLAGRLVGLGARERGGAPEERVDAAGGEPVGAGGRAAGQARE